MPAQPEPSSEVVERLRTKLREAEDMLVAAEELLLATGYSWEDVERDRQAGDLGQNSVRSAAGPYRLLAEQMSEPALTITHSGTVVYCNPAFATLVGIMREQLLGTPLSDIVVRDGTPHTLVERLDHGLLSPQECTLLTAQGPRNVSVSSRSVRLFGKSIFSLVVTKPPRLADELWAREGDTGDGRHGGGDAHQDASDQLDSGRGRGRNGE